MVDLSAVPEHVATELFVHVLLETAQLVSHDFLWLKGTLSVKINLKHASVLSLLRLELAPRLEFEQKGFILRIPIVSVQSWQQSQRRFHDPFVLDYAEQCRAEFHLVDGRKDGCFELVHAMERMAGRELRGLTIPCESDSLEAMEELMRESSELGREGKGRRSRLGNRWGNGGNAGYVNDPMERPGVESQAESFPDSYSAETMEELQRKLRELREWLVCWQQWCCYYCYLFPIVSVIASSIQHHTEPHNYLIDVSKPHRNHLRRLQTISHPPPNAPPTNTVSQTNTPMLLLQLHDPPHSHDDALVPQNEPAEPRHALEGRHVHRTLEEQIHRRPLASPGDST